jgi:phage tail sheath protein FI
LPTDYRSPGVYVEEVPSGANPIQAVGTSTTAFLGQAPVADARLNEAVPVDNWSQFLKEFYKDGATSTPLSHAVFGFLRNGGRRCYVVNLGASQSLTGSGKTPAGLDLLKPIEEVKLVAAPGFTGAAAYDALLSHCEGLGTCFAIMDSPEVVANLDALTKVATATVTPPARRTGGAAADAAPPAPPAPPPADTALKPRMSKGGYGAFYCPWITVRDPFAPDQLVNVPPSGHVAGIYARTDATRGVHKAPANELIRGALNVSFPISRADQEMLNPNGVNCIRLFSREGVMLWGARTVADNATEWRYVNVRRLFNMVEESIGLSTRHVVFEPNDRPLWKQIVRDVRAFLIMLWRDGALMGKTPDEAFFVQCDDETNPPEGIDMGLVVTRIGLAPVKPAEFVVFRIGQSPSGTKIESEG